LGLIGLPANGLAFAPLELPGPTFADLLNSTLGNTGTDGDDLAAATATLSDLMAAFEDDVTATDAADTIPDVAQEILSTAILDALLVEISVASATEIAIGSALDFLAGTFAVWNIFQAIWDTLDNAIQGIFADIRLLNQEIQPNIGGGTAGNQFGPIEF